MITAQRRAAVFVGPAFVVAATAVWYVSDRLVVVGPFDRAQVGWAVVVPLLALAPGLAGLAEREASLASRSRLVANLTAVGIGLVATAALLATVTFANCRPVTSPLDILPQSTVTGLLAGAIFAGPYRASASLARAHRPWAALVTAAGVSVVLGALLVLVVFVVLFPPLSCAPPVST